MYSTAQHDIGAMGSLFVDEPLAILDGHKMRKTEFWICKSNKKVRFQQHHSR